MVSNTDQLANFERRFKVVNLRLEKANEKLKQASLVKTPAAFSELRAQLEPGSKTYKTAQKLLHPQYSEAVKQAFNAKPRSSLDYAVGGDALNQVLKYLDNLVNITDTVRDKVAANKSTVGRDQLLFAVKENFESRFKTMFGGGQKFIQDVFARLLDREYGDKSRLRKEEVDAWDHVVNRSPRLLKGIEVHKYGIARKKDFRGIRALSRLVFNKMPSRLRRTFVPAD